MHAATPFNFDTLATTLLSSFLSFTLFPSLNLYRTPPQHFRSSKPHPHTKPISHLPSHTHTPHRNNGSFSGFVFESFKEVQVTIPPSAVSFVRSFANLRTLANRLVFLGEQSGNLTPAPRQGEGRREEKRKRGGVLIHSCGGDIYSRQNVTDNQVHVRLFR